jgi:thiamine biosynthesis protein ThiS
MNASQNDSKTGALTGSLTLIRLFVNGHPQTLAPPCSVADLLEELEMGGRRVAVAVNRNIVVRSRYKEAVLADGDRIEILEAVGGG